MAVSSPKAVKWALVILLTCALGACRSVTYRALETFGIEKRDILVDRVERAREAQTEARDQFVSALDRFRALVDVDAGELESTYDALAAELRRSEQRAQAVRSRIDAVEIVAEDLFDEWAAEIDDYSDASLRRDSERLLSETRRRYTTLMRAMRRAEEAMAPVLETFEDQVLFLKHNLNARAIGSLRGELASIERQTSSLIGDMERAIAEADRFIASLSDGRAAEG